MSKQVERLKKNLIELTDVINAFQSETVQCIVIDRILNYLAAKDRGAETDINEGDTTIPFNANIIKPDLPGSSKGKKMGSTKILNQLLTTDFFDSPKSIASITDFCATKYDTVLQTSEISGVLLKLIKVNKLSRVKSEETNRYVYLKPV
ncbi:hypothetical protein [Mucilaginibacter paludis]|uniref:Uncharacterized protein n=1 Tax=Mucilaginibacter paludis DSM 18603 TaxID=714943 RepID=H1YHZ9_9SPHI|nr:hypothetical protein [Mucilaginibacter paludis]EHQ25547.1 hypothetical protein Mucpa_1387 [Mucilaginibacter paludis DSM 18603]